MIGFHFIWEDFCFLCVNLENLWGVWVLSVNTLKSQGVFSIRNEIDQGSIPSTTNTPLPQWPLAVTTMDGNKKERMRWIGLHTHQNRVKMMPGWIWLFLTTPEQTNYRSTAPILGAKLGQLQKHNWGFVQLLWTDPKVISQKSPPPKNEYKVVISIHETYLMHLPHRINHHIPGVHYYLFCYS